MLLFSYGKFSQFSKQLQLELQRANCGLRFDIVGSTHGPFLTFQELFSLENSSFHASAYAPMHYGNIQPRYNWAVIFKAWDITYSMDISFGTVKVISHM